MEAASHFVVGRVGHDAGFNIVVGSRTCLPALPERERDDAHAEDDLDSAPAAAL